MGNSRKPTTDCFTPKQQEAGIWTVERILAKEERSDGTFYHVDWHGWALDEASWEPLSNILTANAEVRAFEEVLAAMPRLDAFVASSQSGCCFGKLCQIDQPAGPSLDKCTSCGREHHHLCATENKWLNWIGDEKIEGRKCFDCWLLEAQLIQADGAPAAAPGLFDKSSSLTGAALRSRPSLWAPSSL